jgi:hypothetical protein
MRFQDNFGLLQPYTGNAGAIGIGEPPDRPASDLALKAIQRIKP